MGQIVAALLAVFTLAHPGHGTVALTGELRRVEPDAIFLEIRDVATMQLRTVVILIDEDTKFRLDKERVDPAAMIGIRAVVGADYEESFDGGMIYRATEVRFSKPKAQKPPR